MKEPGAVVDVGIPSREESLTGCLQVGPLCGQGLIISLQILLNAKDQEKVGRRMYEDAAAQRGPVR